MQEWGRVGSKPTRFAFASRNERQPPLRHVKRRELIPSGEQAVSGDQ